MKWTNLHVFLGIIILLINIINLLPVVESPYLGDDSWRESTLRGLTMLTNASWWEVLWETEKDFLKDGRWYPLVAYYFPVFYYLDRFFYKLVVVFLVISNISLFGHFIWLVTSSRSFTLLAMMLPPLFFQFRYYHDPILSYYFLLQIELALLLTSVVFFLHFFRNSKRLFLFLSVLFFTASLLVYEASYGFCVLYGIIAFLHLGRLSRKQAFWSVIPFFSVAGVNVLIAIVLRLYFPSYYEGIQINPNFFEWLTAFSKQAFSALPLSYFLSTDAFSDPPLWNKAFITQLWAMPAVWMLIWFLLSYWCLMKRQSGSSEHVSGLMPIGLAFWLLPGVVVGFSTKYQEELRWGLGYLPVYISYFGVMTLGLSLLDRLFSILGGLRVNVRTTVLFLTTLGGGIVLGINSSNNRAVIQSYMDVELHPRLTIEKALKNRLLESVTNGSYLICGSPTRSWDSPSFYKMHSGLTLQVVKVRGFQMDGELGNIQPEEAFCGYRSKRLTGFYDFRDGQKTGDLCFNGYQVTYEGRQGPVLRRALGPCRNSSAPQVFFLKYDALEGGLGYVVLGKVVTAKVDNLQIYAVCCDHVRVYVALPPELRNQNIFISGTTVDAETLEPINTFRLTREDLVEARRSEAGIIFEIRLVGIPDGADASTIAVWAGQ